MGSLRLTGAFPSPERRTISEAQIEAEIGLITHASATVCEDLKRTMEQIPPSLAEYRDIIAAQIELARDGTLLNGACGRIRKSQVCAAWAIWDTINELIALFDSFSDPYLRDRVQDIRTVGQSLLAALRHEEQSEKPASGIIGAQDLSPADIISLSVDGAGGCISVNGGAASHASILARGLKIPAVSHAENLFSVARDGETCIVDGLQGQVLLGPDTAEIDHYAEIRQQYKAFEEESRKHAFDPAITLDGQHVPVLANLESPAEIPAFAKSGAGGIGLYRTEYSFLGHDLPDEEQLYEEYLSIIRAAGDRPVVFRTLDMGGEKPAGGLPVLAERNPALGLRGIRFCLKWPDIFRRQLRPLLRATAHGNVSLLLPMVTRSDELNQTRRLIAEIAAEPGMDHLADAGGPRLGAMIETPAAVLICQELARQCSFLALGTNDLLHYLLAIDRENRHVAYLNDPFHPAFIRALAHTVRQAHAVGAKVAVCGELAADPYGVVILLGLGVDSLSASPRFVPQIRHLLRRLSARECQSLIDETPPDDLREKIHVTLQSTLGSNLSFYTSQTQTRS